jgi:hypothetical protein
MHKLILASLAAAGIASAALPALAGPTAEMARTDTAVTQGVMLDKVQWRGRGHREFRRDFRSHRAWRAPYRGYYYSSCRWGYWRDRWGRLHCRNGW